MREPIVTINIFRKTEEEITSIKQEQHVIKNEIFGKQKKSSWKLKTQTKK